MQVYLVWYDNGLDYEDHQIHLQKIFDNLESAEKFKELKSVNEFTPSLTREQYYAQPEEFIECAYHEWLESEYYMWSHYNSGTYFIEIKEIES